MKLGKRKLANILERETGIPKSDILLYGRYDHYGNKEVLVVGSHTIVSANGKISIMDPVYQDDDVHYKTRVIEGGEKREGDCSN